MFAFLKHKFTRKDKKLAKWGVSHVLIALIAGALLAGWLVMWQGHKDHSRMAVLEKDAAETVDQPNPVPPNTANLGGPFTLTSQDGKVVTEKDFAGKYLLIYFGYTSCPDMCPTGLQSMSRAMDMLKGNADKVQPLFITVDPGRDTPQHLKDYDASYHPRIIGLTGTNDQIAAVAKEYQVFYEKGEGDQDYEVEHSSLIYLMDPQGKLVATFDEEVDPSLIVAALEKSGVPEASP